MEAVWSRCLPAYEELRSHLRDNKIGEPCYLRADFGVPISHIPRVNQSILGGGTVFDLGVYVLQLASLVYGNKPFSVFASGNLNDDGVDENVDYILKYSNGKIANLCTHSKFQMENHAVIYGTSGAIKIKDPFWCPTILVLPDGEKEFPLPFKCDNMNFKNSEGLAYEAMEVRECIKNGLVESPKMTHDDSLAIAKIQEAVCKLINATIYID